MNTKTALKIAKILDSEAIREDARAIIEAYEAYEDQEDFTVELNEGEYRIIHDDAIEDIFDSEIRQLADDCYEIKDIKKKMGGVGMYFTFDYDSFVKDCRTDGYGYHFSSYNGSEESVGPWNIFRVN